MEPIDYSLLDVGFIADRNISPILRFYTRNIYQVVHWKISFLVKI
jgi:hypothetical protein